MKYHGGTGQTTHMPRRRQFKSQEFFSVKNRGPNYIRGAGLFTEGAAGFSLVRSGESRAEDFPCHSIPNLTAMLLGLALGGSTREHAILVTLTKKGKNRHSSLRQVT